MANEKIIIGSEASRPFYANGKIVRVYEEDIYDIKFVSGEVEAYVENVSSFSYNIGNYVAVLMIIEGDSRSCKIIGRGRKMTESSSIEEVRV